MNSGRASLFAMKPADGTEDVVVPPHLVEQMKVRLADCLDDLASIVGSKSKVALAEKIKALHALHYCASTSATLSQRKARLTRLAEIFAGVEEVFDLVAASKRDDPGMFFSPVIKTVVEAIGPAIAARDGLQAELARLGPASQSDGQNPERPVQHFLLSAEILWTEETGWRARRSSRAYRDWLSLLFYVVTGEADRSFAKALRNLTSHMLQG
jgi:hypothetical protein